MIIVSTRAKGERKNSSAGARRIYLFDMKCNVCRLIVAALGMLYHRTNRTMSQHDSFQQL